MATATKRRPAARRKSKQSKVRAKSNAKAARSRVKAARAPRFEGTREALNEQLATHRSDAAAIAAAVVGVLVALGVYTRAAGPLGRGMDTLFGAMFGRGRLLVPLADFSVTAALLLRRGEDEDLEDEQRRGW